MLPADPLSKISLMAWPSILASVYMTVIGFSSRAALLNNGISIVSFKSKGKMAVSNSLLVTVVDEMLLNWGSVGGQPLPISSFVVLFSVFGFCIEVSFRVVFEWFEIDRLLVAVVNILWMAVVNILLVAVIDKLGSDILVLNKLAAVSLIGKCFGIDLDFDIDFGFGIRDWGFNVDFPIIGYKHCSWLLCDLVYHSCGRHTFSAVMVDYLMMMNMLDFGNDWHFSDYCVFGEVDKWTDGLYESILVVVAVKAVVVAQVVGVVVEVAAVQVRLLD
ncbi:hypothetical protein G9A89_015160 [Geosiphon pyriformis]|nr:hypothetical protein G9A89_015160 [Geosiphon pyriformis]